MKCQAQNLHKISQLDPIEYSLNHSSEPLEIHLFDDRVMTALWSSATHVLYSKSDISSVCSNTPY